MKKRKNNIYDKNIYKKYNNNKRRERRSHKMGAPLLDLCYHQGSRSIHTNCVA
jgi:hypothetical protein